jgi:hypothetical protein
MLKKFQDLDNPNYSNINMFKKIETGLNIHDMQEPRLARSTEASVTV